MQIKLELEREDIFKMSDTLFNLDGFTTFELSSEDTAFGLKEILIRNILTLFGESYHITSIEAYKLDEDCKVASLIIKTNLPYDALGHLTPTFGEIYDNFLG